MTFRERIEDIRRGYASGALALPQAVQSFEHVLRGYGLIDLFSPFPREMTEPSLLYLLRAAWDNYPELGEMPERKHDPEDFLKACPVCGLRVPRLYNSFQDRAKAIHLVGPAAVRPVHAQVDAAERARVQRARPRRGPDGPTPTEGELPFTPDMSPVQPLDDAEKGFFERYEREMRNFKG